MEIKNVKNKKKETRLLKQDGILMPPHPSTKFEIKNIIKMNLDLMLFIREIIYKK